MAAPSETPVKAVASTEKPVKSVVVRPEKPNEVAYRAALDAARKEHDVAQATLNEIKKKAEMSKPGAPMSPRQQEINAQMNELKAQAAPKRAAIKKIDDQIRHLNSNAEKIKDMNARSSSLPYRNLAELEKAIRDLDAKVSTGKMKIVDEKKAQQEILVLNRRKNDFKAIEDLQKTVDADRLKIEALEEQRAEAGYQDIEAQIKKLDAEYKTIKAERDHATKSFGELREQRTKAQKLQQAKWEAMKEIKDKHHQALNAYYEYTREAKLIRDARQKAEYEAGELERKRERAAERIEIASEPAFASEIITCESLIAYFDPSSAEAARKAKQTAAPRELAAKATREVKPVDGKLLVKKEEVYFIGTGGKKKGKMPRGAASPALAAAAASTEAPSTKALHINVGLLEELSKVNAPTPTGPDDVPRVLEYLRKQLKYYKDNQDRVTKENIAKAQKEIDKIEREEAAKTGNSRSTPAVVEKKVAEVEAPVAAVVEEKPVEEKAAAETEA